MNNKAKIKKIVKDMLKESYSCAERNIDKAINSGAIDINGWDESMVIPKIILTAILEEAARQYTGRGTRYESKVKKEVKNLKMFL